MDYAKVESLARKLPPQEQLRLARSLLQSLRAGQNASAARNALKKGRFPVPPDSSLPSVLGVLRAKGQKALSDKQARDAAADYLLEKYS